MRQTIWTIAHWGQLRTEMTWDAGRGVAPQLTVVGVVGQELRVVLRPTCDTLTPWRSFFWPNRAHVGRNAIQSDLNDEPKGTQRWAVV